MARILAKIARVVRLDDHETHVHFHTARFWADADPEICYDADCMRPRAQLD